MVKDSVFSKALSTITSGNAAVSLVGELTDNRRATYGSFVKGMWKVGASEDDVTGCEAVILFAASTIYKIAWKTKDGAKARPPLKTAQVPVGTPIPATLDDNPHAQKAISLAAMVFDGAQEFPVRFEGSSRGFINAVKDLAREVAKHDGPGQFPVVTLGASSYHHDEFGDVDVPDFVLVRWVAAQ